MRNLKLQALHSPFTANWYHFIFSFPQLQNSNKLHYDWWHGNPPCPCTFLRERIAFMWGGTVSLSISQTAYTPLPTNSTTLNGSKNAQSKTLGTAPPHCEYIYIYISLSLSLHFQNSSPSKFQQNTPMYLHISPREDCIYLRGDSFHFSDCIHNWDNANLWIHCFDFSWQFKR